MLIAQMIGSQIEAPDVAHPHLPEGKIGIELELEGLTHWPAIQGWTQVPDGSLRDGIEYVFNGPQGGTRALKSIKLMAAMAKTHNPEPSFRCSTHIHMDVRDLEFAELELLVMAYTMTEGVMFDHCTLERRFSNFCTPFFLNSYLPRLFTRMIHGDNEQMKLRQITQWPKYTSLNLKPVTTYGSVEFRGSSAFTTEQDLLGLAQRMLHLKRVSKGFTGNKLQFIEHLRNTPLDGIFPQGLREGYIPDERIMDIGYASAIGIAVGNMSSQPANPMDELRRAAPAPQRGTDHRIRLVSATLDRYNLFRAAGEDTRLRMTELFQLIRQLRRMRGITAPTLRDFVDRSANPAADLAAHLGGVQNISRILRDVGMTIQDIGSTADDLAN